MQRDSTSHQSLKSLCSVQGLEKGVMTAMVAESLSDCICGVLTQSLLQVLAEPSRRIRGNCASSGGLAKFFLGAHRVLIGCSSGPYRGLIGGLSGAYRELIGWHSGSYRGLIGDSSGSNRQVSDPLQRSVSASEDPVAE